ncbi:hypothetical protein DFH07DRAFT_768441 [Mycena maculata]|uniref:Uncharacterized protein n=1 Tax=Mycena maculata TaxID=230809 RepID=A0AAD7JUZ2_9AGAR|nr:hypothetical protein DFH07DRAFT_768441 [Mycena maculata]
MTPKLRRCARSAGECASHERCARSREHTEAEILPLPIPPVNLPPELASQGVTNFEDQGIDWDANGQRFEAHSAPSRGRLVGTFRGTCKEKEPACDACKEENKRGVPQLEHLSAGSARQVEVPLGCQPTVPAEVKLGRNVSSTQNDTLILARETLLLPLGSAVASRSRGSMTKVTKQETPLRSLAAPVPQVGDLLNVGGDPPAADNSGDFSEDDNSSSDSNSMNESGDSETEQGLSGITAERATRLGQVEGAIQVLRACLQDNLHHHYSMSIVCSNPAPENYSGGENQDTRPIVGGDGGENWVSREGRPAKAAAAMEGSEGLRYAQEEEDFGGNSEHGPNESMMPVGEQYKSKAASEYTTEEVLKSSQDYDEKCGGLREVYSNILVAVEDELSHSDSESESGVVFDDTGKSVVTPDSKRHWIPADDWAMAESCGKVQLVIGSQSAITSTLQHQEFSTWSQFCMGTRFKAACKTNSFALQGLDTLRPNDVLCLTRDMADHRVCKGNTSKAEEFLFATVYVLGDRQLRVGRTHTEEENFTRTMDVQIGVQDVVTWFDSSCTTEGISPEFAHVAGINVNLIDSPVTLQLGAARSYSKVNHGTEPKGSAPSSGPATSICTTCNRHVIVLYEGSEVDENLAHMNDTKYRGVSVLVKDLGNFVGQYGEAVAELLLLEFSRERFLEHHTVLPNQQRPNTEYSRRVKAITAFLKPPIMEEVKCWMEYPSCFEFDIWYIKDDLNTSAGCLSLYNENSNEGEIHELEELVNMDIQIDRAMEYIPLEIEGIKCMKALNASMLKAVADPAVALERERNPGEVSPEDTTEFSSNHSTDMLDDSEFRKVFSKIAEQHLDEIKSGKEQQSSKNLLEDWFSKSSTCALFQNTVESRKTEIVALEAAADPAVILERESFPVEDTTETCVMVNARLDVEQARTLFILLFKKDISCGVALTSYGAHGGELGIYESTDMLGVVSWYYTWLMNKSTQIAPVSKLQQWPEDILPVIESKCGRYRLLEFWWDYARNLQLTKVNSQQSMKQSDWTQQRSMDMYDRARETDMSAYKVAAEDNGTEQVLRLFIYKWVLQLQEVPHEDGWHIQQTIEQKKCRPEIQKYVYHQRNISHVKQLGQATALAHNISLPHPLVSQNESRHESLLAITITISCSPRVCNSLLVHSRAPSSSQAMHSTPLPASGARRPSSIRSNPTWLHGELHKSINRPAASRSVARYKSDVKEMPGEDGSHVINLNCRPPPATITHSETLQTGSSSAYGVSPTVTIDNVSHSRRACQL